MAKLPVTIIFIARRNSIPKWLDKYLTTHLKIHRPSWKIKSDRGRAFDVDILTEMATKEWMQDIEKYFKLWRDWAKKNSRAVITAPPAVELPPERPPPVHHAGTLDI